MFGQNVFAGKYTYSTSGEGIVANGRSIDESFEGEFTVNIAVHETYTKYVQKQLPEYGWQCSREYYSGDGDGNWYGYYNVPKYKKAKALEDAILGVGPARSKVLARGRYFIPKPRSWKSFVRELRKAENQNPKSLRGLVADVTGDRYRQRNMQNLGYDFGSTGDCELTVVGYEWDWVSVTDSRFVRNESVPVKLRLRGIILDNHETQKMKITLAHNELNDRGEYSFKLVGQSNGYQSSPHSFSVVNQFREVLSSGDEWTPNTYKYMLDVVATRNKKRPSVGDIALSFSKVPGKNAVEIKIQDKTKSTPDSLSGLAFVEVTVMKDGFMFFNSEIAKETFQLDPSKVGNVFRMNAKVAGKDVYIKYNVTRTNSLIYSSRASSTADTETKEF